VADTQNPQPAEALERLGRLSLRELSMDSLLQTVADLTKTVMPGSPEASVSGRAERLATLKTELIYRRCWPTRHELEMEVFSYLEGFYNTRRRHSRLGNLSPTEYETTHLTQNEVSA
jgi:transposase InsO family protein